MLHFPQERVDPTVETHFDGKEALEVARIQAWKSVTEREGEDSHFRANSLKPNVVLELVVERLVQSVAILAQRTSFY